jgi:hypothetical protein
MLLSDQQVSKSASASKKPSPQKNRPSAKTTAGTPDLTDILANSCDFWFRNA